MKICSTVFQLVATQIKKYTKSVSNQLVPYHVSSMYNVQCAFDIEKRLKNVMMLNNNIYKVNLLSLKIDIHQS